MMTHFDYETLWVRTQGVLERISSARRALEALVCEVRRRTRRDPFPALASFDLEKDIEDVAEQLDFVFREEPPPPEIDHLLIGICSFVDAQGNPPRVACHVRGQHGYRPNDLDWLCEPLYSVSKYEILSNCLDLILKADEEEQRSTNGGIVGLGLLLPAVGVLFRAAVKRLALSYTVAVITGDGGCPYVLR